MDRISGFTSQIGGFLNKAKPPPAEEQAGVGGESNSNDAATSGADVISLTANADAGDATTTTTATSAASSVLNASLTLVTSKLPSWFGGKGAVVATEAEPSPTPVQEPVSSLPDPDANKAPPEIAEQDPAAEGQAAAGLGKVKSFGVSLFSSMKGVGQKIKDTVPNAVSEFQKEHESFLRSKPKSSEAVAPWVGHPKEEELKAEILELSNDRRNFVRSPPTGVSYDFNLEAMIPVAQAILQVDPRLADMRKSLVPQIVSEQEFFRNYFYRVSLLSASLSEDEGRKKRNDSVETDEEGDEIEKELNEELKSFEVVDSSSAKKSDVDEKELDSLLDLK